MEQKIFLHDNMIVNFDDAYLYTLYFYICDALMTIYVLDVNTL